SNEAAAPAPVRTMRVDLDRIDRLVDLVGEIAISQSILTQDLSPLFGSPHSAAAADLEGLAALIRELQDHVMTLRSQPVKPLFQRMGRLLRETAQAAGKRARLHTEGEMTEVDCSVIDALAEPLTHMLRNAIDHGIETPERRRAAGKPETGTVTLAASHRSGRVVIELADDGAGLDRAAILRRAIERGLLAPGSRPAQDEIDALIFRPGFTTAASLSAISGRGVGMDVVRSTIARLGGRIAVASEPGAGTRVTLSLPLTLAVAEGLVVRVGRERLVIPVTAIRETAQLARLPQRQLDDGTRLVRLRDRFVPLVEAGAWLGLRPPAPPDPQAIAILAETEAGERRALVVDAILDHRQVVIKPLRTGFGALPGIAAATILGDGGIALILDPEDLARPGTAAPREARTEPA
ncbi:chemotaxis protein CheA, partial [Albidovulum sp.]